MYSYYISIDELKVLHTYPASYKVKLSIIYIIILLSIYLYVCVYTYIFKFTIRT